MLNTIKQKPDYLLSKKSSLMAKEMPDEKRKMKIKPYLQKLTKPSIDVNQKPPPISRSQSQN